MRKLVVGDIHGHATALKKVLKDSKFDFENDKLIILGDVCDGRAHTKEVVDILLKVKNRVFVIGNHDAWFIDFLRSPTDNPPWVWIDQGGRATLFSYGFGRAKDVFHLIPPSHKDFFLKEPVAYHEEDGMCFVHGGWPYGSSPRFEVAEVLMWDRSLIYKMKNGGEITQYKHVFVGHTTTQMFNSVLPLTFGQLIMMDTGAGGDGKLTLMDIHTKEFWQA